ncbi:MAG: PEGA domain-containing protein [Vicinamibacterales bacterium]
MEPAVAHMPSQPPVVFRDGFGERRRVTGPTEADSVDVLYLREELTEVPSFEFALRERASRLAQFRHPLFARVRNVERLSDQSATIVVVSETTQGVRLSDLLATSLPLEIPAVLHLLRQLVPAVAALHKFAPDAAHGAIGPERIIVTPDARLVIVEYVMGAAIERLRYSHEQYWKDLRVAFPRPAVVLKNDQRTDVTQIGVVALSLILGRLIHAEEYPRSIGEIVSSAWSVSAQGGSASAPVDLRTWLARAVQLDARTGFASAVEAEAALEGLLGEIDYAAAASALATFIAEYHDLVGEIVEPNPPPMTAPKLVAAATVPVPINPAPAPVSPAPAPQVVATPAAVVVPVAAVVAAEEPAAATVQTAPPAGRPTSGTNMPRVATSPSDSFSRPEMQEHALPRDRRSAGWFRVAAAALLVVAVGGGAVAARRYFASANQAAGSGRLIVDTTPPGAQVVVDGKASGTTPVTLTLQAGVHTVEVRGGGIVRSIPVTVVAGTEVAQYIELPKGSPAPGQLQVRTEPAGARVTVDGLARGLSPVTIGDLAPGQHSVVLEGDSGSAKQTVTVEAGVTASLVVQLTPQGVPLSGWISVSAPEAVQLYEDGRLLGSSQTEQLMVAAGTHQLSIVNQALGYQTTRTVTVGAGKVSSIKIDFPKGTIAVNATPWAEVWIDGVKLGETPIGNAPLVIGSHQVVFRHPDLGEQRHVVTVTTTAPAKLSVDMRKQ